MHDIRAIRENPAAFDAALARRGLSGLSSEILALDNDRRAKILAAETAQADGSAGSAQGFFGDRVDPRGHDPIVELAILFEAFLTAPQGQLDRFTLKADGVAQPHFLPNSRTAEEIEILGELHAGALAYTHDLLRWYGPQIVDLAFNPAVALEPLSAFSQGRLLAPAAVLKALRVDDAFCGYGEHEVGLKLAGDLAS